MAAPVGEIIPIERNWRIERERLRHQIECQDEQIERQTVQLGVLGTRVGHLQARCRQLAAERDEAQRLLGWGVDR